MLNAVPIRRFARLTALAWAGGSVLVGAAAWLAALMPPLELLYQAAPFWLAATLIGLVAARFALPDRRERLLASIAFTVAATSHLASIAPELLRPIPQPVNASADTPRVRVVWLNTQSGSSPEDVTNYLVNSGADFLMLAEFPEDGIPAELQAVYPHRAACYEPHDCNVVILSRHAPLAQRYETETATELRMTWADFEIAGAPLRVVATHLNRPYPANRYRAQRGELLNFIADGPSDAILAGDFNAAPWSFALRQFDDESGLTRHDRAMPTWPAAAWTRLRLPAPEAFMPIDHIYSGGNWRLVSVRRGPRTRADHFPIEAEFAWSPES
jgi:endonuclease/exonuclease/phosphatase (EEP) superfamily protein YafD